MKSYRSPWIICLSPKSFSTSIGSAHLFHLPGQCQSLRATDRLSFLKYKSRTLNACSFNHSSETGGIRTPDPYPVKVMQRKWYLWGNKISHR